MKKLIALFCLCILPYTASAQCNGVFSANQVCGATTSSPPHAIAASSFTIQLQPATTTISPSTPNGILIDNNGILGDSTTITSPTIVGAVITSPTITTGTLSQPTIQSPTVTNGSFSSATITSSVITTGTISGSTIDSATIGNTTQASGAFTTLSATSTTSLNANVKLGASTVVAWNADTGLSRDSAGVIDVGNGTAGNRGGTIYAGELFAPFIVTSDNSTVALDQANSPVGAKLGSGSGLYFSSTANWFGTPDTGITRDSAGVIDFGVGSAQSSAATLQMSSFIISGTPKFNVFSTGASTQTFTNSPCSTLTTERWIKVTIVGSTSNFFVPACS